MATGKIGRNPSGRIYRRSASGRVGRATGSTPCCCRCNTGTMSVTLSGLTICGCAVSGSKSRAVVGTLPNDVAHCLSLRPFQFPDVEGQCTWILDNVATDLEIREYDTTDCTGAYTTYAASKTVWLLSYRPVPYSAWSLLVNAHFATIGQRVIFESESAGTSSTWPRVTMPHTFADGVSRTCGLWAGSSGGIALNGEATIDIGCLESP